MLPPNGGDQQHGASVTQLQDALRAKGFSISDAKGTLGKSTSDAITAFQKSQRKSTGSFMVDGKAGPQTLGALGLAPPTADGGQARRLIGGPAATTARRVGDRTTPGALTAGQLAGADNARRAPPKRTGPKQIVAAKRTNMSGSQAASALSSAWTQRYGRPPSKQTLAVLTAQWSHETGGGKSMLNYNFGGIKGVGPSGLTARYKTREGWGKTERKIVDGFRAYRSPQEGASDYLSLLDRKYPEALNAARNGDTAGFVRGLKQRRYFTGNEAAYTRNVSRLANLAMNNGFNAVG